MRRLIVSNFVTFDGYYFDPPVSLKLIHTRTWRRGHDECNR
jgi:hypothetical protein